MSEHRRELRGGREVELAGDGDQVPGVDGVVFEGVRHSGNDLIRTAVEHGEECAKQRGGPEVADLGPQQRVVDHRQDEPDDERRGAEQPRRGGPAGLVARERRLVQRPRDQVQPHRDRDERQAPAAVARAVVEQDVHRPRPDREQPDRHRAREAGDRQHGDADRAPRGGAVRARLEPGEVGEERPLDGLEELQRRPRDQQDVEHEARDGRVLRGQVGGDHGAVEQRLLGQHDQQHGDGEAPAARHPEVVVARAPLPGRRRPAREGERHDDERDERRRRHAHRDGVLAARDPDRHGEREQQPRRRLEEDEPAVEPEPLVPGEPAAREVARRVGEDGDEEDPVQRRGAVEQPVLDRAAQRERDDREGEREAALDQQRRAQRVVVLVAAGAALGDRAREQLLDRPVDHRHGHEQHRPEQRDRRVLGVAQDVRRDREVRERDDPGRRDADREDARAAAVAASPPD